jgi:hypothetical protein
MTKASTSRELGTTVDAQQVPPNEATVLLIASVALSTAFAAGWDLRLLSQPMLAIGCWL